MLPEKFNSDHKRSIQIYNNESLNGSIYSRGVSGDIFVILAYIMHEAVTEDEVKSYLYQIKKYICNLFGYENINIRQEPKIDWLWFLRPIQIERKKEVYLENLEENKILNPNIINQYIPYLHKIWYEEGIDGSIKDIFDIRFDLQSDRIVFPIHNRHGELIGVKGRYIGKDEFIPKYLYMYPFSKSIELFNLHRALPYIKEKKQVIIFEGAKTTMLATKYGIKNCVSIEGDKISASQIKLLKELGIDIEWIFVFDSDKEVNFVVNQIKNVKNRKIYIMDDKDRLLGDRVNKRSPTDLGKEIFIKLLENYVVPIDTYKNL